MTIEEFEKLAVGMDTGYRDRNGMPICVGDSVVYYKKCTRHISDYEDEPDISSFPKNYIVGEGWQEYVYTGKIIRQRHTVSFSFEQGLRILSGNKYKFLYETGEDGRLLTILVDNEKKNPKLTFEQVIGLDL